MNNNNHSAMKYCNQEIISWELTYDDLVLAQWWFYNIFLLLAGHRFPAERCPYCSSPRYAPGWERWPRGSNWSLPGSFLALGVRSQGCNTSSFCLKKYYLVSPAKKRVYLRVYWYGTNKTNQIVIWLYLVRKLELFSNISVLPLFCATA